VSPLGVLVVLHTEDDPVAHLSGGRRLLHHSRGHQRQRRPINGRPLRSPIKRRNHGWIDIGRRVSVAIDPIAVGSRSPVLP
jgi:hypothetical protein